MSATNSHNILRQSRVVGARSVLWLRTGGKLVYERQGLLGSHLGSWCANMLAFVMTTRFEMFPWGRKTCLDRKGWTWMEWEEGTRKQATAASERHIESNQRCRRTNPPRSPSGIGPRQAYQKPSIVIDPCQCPTF